MKTGVKLNANDVMQCDSQKFLWHFKNPTPQKEKTLLSRQRHDLHAAPHPLFL
jgi:hypothetical protein